jgi:CheY-like chemotaxis protein
LTTTLLAVDDSKTMRKVLEITFSSDEYHMVVAESGQQALEKLRSDRPTVVLLDAHLGGESGYDLCQALKREAPGVGVIILSSKQQPYDKARGASVGADDFMDKPFDTQQLLDKTGMLLRRLREAPAAAPAVAAAPAARPAPAPAPSPAPPVAAPMPQPRVQPMAQQPMAQQRPAPAQVAPTGAARPHVQTLVGGAPPPARAAAPAPVAAAAAVTAGNGQFAERLAGLGLTRDQVDGVLSLSREIVEQVVWEVVPQLAETIIKEEIRRLTSE